MFERILVENLTGKDLSHIVGCLDLGKVPSLQDEVDQEGPRDDELDKAAEPGIYLSSLILVLHSFLESLVLSFLLCQLLLLALIGFLHLLKELLLLLHLFFDVVLTRQMLIDGHVSLEDHVELGHVASGHDGAQGEQLVLRLLVVYVDAAAMRLVS